MGHEHGGERDSSLSVRSQGESFVLFGFAYQCWHRGVCTPRSLKTGGCPHRTHIRLSPPPEWAVRTGGAETVVSFLIITNSQVRARLYVDWSSQLETPQPTCGLVAYSTSADPWRSHPHVTLHPGGLPANVSSGNTRGRHYIWERGMFWEGLNLLNCGV